MEHSFERLTTPGQDGKQSPRSYVLRAGHMTDKQKDALQRFYEKYGIPWEPGRIVNALSLFGPRMIGSFIVEIGFGMGDATANIAEALPATGFFGIEVHAPGVGQMLLEIERRGLKNLKICRHDAMEVVESMLAPDSVDGFHVFFPDPWPKKKHHKRRIMRQDFVRFMARRLKPSGYLYFVTDWEEYAEATLEVLRSETLLVNTYEVWADRESWRPITKFEKRAADEGRTVRELIFRRI
ncbi:MAG: tRNA (guanosine(46)-N7)-methyltransferase TrmB [Spirochaetes bacterium RIFOXYC1_FULL_54_7]|nr:MAG: tRNA (guanosine(46)-N7)-methyltransferase TrmB [Spirochaetes bacterium RIFOXYC1_FULL_54_7]